MTKYLACLLVLATSGCPDVKADSGEGELGPTVEFDPAAQVLPFPNNLVMCATGTDASGAPCTIGKVAIPPPACETPAAKAIRTTTLNQLDGFGAFEAAMQVTFTKPVDETSLAGHIVMYQRTKGGADNDPGTATPIPTRLIKGTALRFTEGKCSAPATIDAVTVVPLVPLDQKSTYTVAVLTGIKTADGADYGPSPTWALVNQTDDPVTLDAAGDIVAERTPLQPGQDANGNGVPDAQEIVGLDGVWKLHAKAIGFLIGTGVQRADILVAWEVTTQTVTDPLDPAVAGSPASAVSDTSGFLGIQSVTCDLGPLCPNGIDRTAQPYSQCPLTDNNTQCFLKINLAVGSGATGTAIYPTGDGICGQVGCAAVGDILGGIIISTSYQQPLPNPLAGGAAIPGAWSDPVAPADQGGVQLQALVVIPAGVAPAAGWPTLVFGHGLTSSKSALVAFAPQLAAKLNMASIAIDFVDHGSRAVRISDTGDCAGTTLDPSAKPLCFASIISADLGQTRDNFRQTVLDLQRVVKVTKYCGTHACTSATASGGTDPAPSTFKVDPAHIVYAGQSLGGIIGTTTSATSPTIVSALLDVSAVGLVDVLEHTDTLAIRCSLVDALIDAGVLSGNKSTDASPLCADEAWQAQPGYQQFSGIARWVLDPADGANFMSRLVAKKIFLQEVVDDEVVPNYATDIQGALAGLTPATADPATSATPAPSGALTPPNTSKWLRYPTLPAGGAFPGNTFAHASLLRPANGGLDGQLGTVRLQTDALFFLGANH
jgi:pimeloyl-ACP methyl ester carboxylesterase